MAASRLVAGDVVDITLIGDEEKIKNKALQSNIPIDFDKVSIISPATSPHYKEYVNTFYELRKHKGINLTMARDMMLDVSYFGSMLRSMDRTGNHSIGMPHVNHHRPEV